MFLCQVCPKTYKSRQSLRKHQRGIHDGIKYPCASCSKVFTQNIHRQRHDLNYHQGMGVPCPICFKSFTSVHNARRHQKDIHKTDPHIDFWSLNNPTLIDEVRPETQSPQTLINLQPSDPDICSTTREADPPTTAVVLTESLPEKPIQLDEYFKIWRRQTEELITALSLQIPSSDVKVWFNKRSLKLCLVFIFLCVFISTRGGKIILSRVTWLVARAVDILYSQNILVNIYRRNVVRIYNTCNTVMCLTLNYTHHLRNLGMSEYSDTITTAYRYMFICFSI